MKKITLSTAHAFIKKNRARLFIKIDRDREGFATDLHIFKPAMPDDGERSEGVLGLYIYPRTDFQPYDDGKYTGIQWCNSCGGGAIAVQKEGV